MHVSRPTEAIAPPSPTAPTSDVPVSRATPAQAGRFAATLASLGRAIDEGDARSLAALGPGAASALSPGELLALQTGIYRWVEAVDLATKLVDRAASAVKTVVQSQ